MRAAFDHDPGLGGEAGDRCLAGRERRGEALRGQVCADCDEDHLPRPSPAPIATGFRLYMPASGLILSNSYRYLSWQPTRSEEHTSELQSLMRISYAVFCLKKKKKKKRD